MTLIPIQYSNTLMIITCRWKVSREDASLHLEFGFGPTQPGLDVVLGPEARVCKDKDTDYKTMLNIGAMFLENKAIVCTVTYSNFL